MIEPSRARSHTSLLADGINAVVKAAELICRLQKLADKVNTREYLLPSTETIMKSRFSINKCVGYVANNNVPDRCEIIIDRRYTPSETAEQAKTEIQEVIDGLKVDDPEFEVEVDYNYENGNPVSVSPAARAQLIQQTSV